MWICEKNELTIKEVLERSISDFEERLLSEEKYEKIKLLQSINFVFLKILYEKLEILVGKEKYWELIRGVYNYVKKINEIEQKLGIKKADKRVRKTKDREVDFDDKKEENKRKKFKNNEKIKKREYNIKPVTKDKIICRFTEGKDTKSWNLTMKLV
ncbi:hypothetical protein RhiirA4_476218 [Rhizophagus irregularis]|uniref:Uncharacterized protein n=1 Tax=Rhizophagus irregularis TaxID=588596 RepID=A0A2I1HB82_9GLOM|nr:hypothetical protein RhiirA4_476218 [Rhizophagus irregularis]